MSKEIQRMMRIREIMEAVPISAIPRRVFAARMSLKFGISTRTINDYITTMIDSGSINEENKLIWREDV